MHGSPLEGRATTMPPTGHVPDSADSAEAPSFGTQIAPSRRKTTEGRVHRDAGAGRRGGLPPPARASCDGLHEVTGPLGPDAWQIDALSESARGTLFECMKEVLRESMRHGRIPTEPGWLESVRDDPEAR